MTMSTTHFLIAKFIPDLRRMEPRNFGVVVWSDGHFAAKFAGEERLESDKFRVRPPSYLQVSSPDAYRQWINYWRTLMSRPTIVSRRGEVVPREDIDFLRNLQSKSREQFALVEGGQLFEHVPPDELPAVADELFAELVALPTHRDQAHALAAIQLRKSAKRVLKQSELVGRDDFHEDYHCVCQIGDAHTAFEFDYALHTTAPTAIIQRVPLWKLDAVHSTAFAFRSVRDQFQLAPERCLSLVYATNSELEAPSTRDSIALMTHFGKVLNLCDEGIATTELSRLAC